MLVMIAKMFFASFAYGQVLPDSAGLEALIEALDADRDIDDELLQSFYDALENPIDLNRCTNEDLRSIPILSPVVSSAIVSWREEHGPFQRIEDLQQIPVISNRLLEVLRPFITVDAANRPNPRAPVRFSMTLNYRRRLDPARGFLLDENGYEGGPATRYARIKIHRRESFAAQLVLESDAGERFFWNPDERMYGFDHITGYFAIERQGILRQVVVGDYRIESGQGLAAWSPFGRGKGVDPTSDPIRTSRGARPSASREEQAFFRGGAVRLSPFGRFHATLFASQRRLDASVDSLAGGTLHNITSLTSTGYHRTPSERAKRDLITSRVFGVLADVNLDRLQVGFTAFENRFSLPFASNPTPAGRYDFTGSRLQTTALHASLALGRAFVWSEAARSETDGWAAVAGLLFQPSAAMESVLMWRHFSANYQSFYANGFAESRSAPKNESGFYTAIQWSVARDWQVGVYHDTYEHPWLRHTVALPSRGSESYIRVTYAPRKWLNVYAHYRIERKDEGALQIDRHGRLVKSIVRTTRRNVRFQIDYRFSDWLTLRNRIESRKYRSRESSTGMLLYQDAILSPTASLNLHIRLALFDAPNQKSAIYAYENDVLYQSRVSSFIGSGLRHFILLKYRPGNHLTLEIKYAATRYGEAIERGSGLDAFHGDRIREINAQIIWRV